MASGHVLDRFREIPPDNLIVNLIKHVKHAHIHCFWNAWLKQLEDPQRWGKLDYTELIWPEIQIIKQSCIQKVNTDLFRTVILESATSAHEYKPLCIIVWCLRGWETTQCHLNVMHVIRLRSPGRQGTTLAQGYSNSAWNSTFKC